MDESRPEGLEDVLGDDGVVDAAVLVPAQRRHAVAPDVAHLSLPPKSETPAGGGKERGREGMGEAEVGGGEGWWWDW